MKFLGSSAAKDLCETQEKRKGACHGDLTAKSGDARASRTCPFAWLTWVVHENGNPAGVASPF